MTREASNDFRPAAVNEYASWLCRWLEAGHGPTYYYDYPMARRGVLVPTQPFELDGECGARSRLYLVYEPEYFLGGDLGHNGVFLFDGPEVVGGHFPIPVFSDPEFRGLSAELDEFIKTGKAKRKERRKQRDQYRQRP